MMKKETYPLFLPPNFLRFNTTSRMTMTKMMRAKMAAALEISLEKS